MEIYGINFEHKHKNQEKPARRVRCSLVHLQENVLVKGYRNNQKMNDNKDMYNTNLNVCSLQWGLDNPLERS